MRDLPCDNIPSLPLKTYCWAVITTLSLKSKWIALEHCKLESLKAERDSLASSITNTPHRNIASDQLICIQLI
jgi:hypothetical protein